MSDSLTTAEEGAKEPKPIPVRKRFYLAACPNCGWVGSSEQCGSDFGSDDSDVYCPKCYAAGCEEEPTEEETAAHGERVMQRILAAEAEVERLKAFVSDYEEAMADKRRLARMIDVAMHGEEGAALQPSLCDLVGSAQALRERVARLEGALKAISERATIPWPAETRAAQMCDLAVAALKETPHAE